MSRSGPYPPPPDLPARHEPLIGTAYRRELNVGNPLGLPPGPLPERRAKWRWTKRRRPSGRTLILLAAVVVVGAAVLVLL